MYFNSNVYMVHNDINQNPKEITIKAFSPSKMKQIYFQTDLQAEVQSFEDQQQSGGDKEIKLISQIGENLDL